VINLAHPLVVGLALVLAGAALGTIGWFFRLMWQLTSAVGRLASNQDDHSERLTDLEKWRDTSKDRAIERLEAEKKALEMELAEAVHLG